MLFPTTDFAIFLAVVFALSWLLNPHRTVWKWFILVASYVFYAWWDPRLVWLLALVSTIAWASAMWVERTDDDRARRRRTLVAVAALLLPLAWFKYYGFFAVNVTNAFESLGFHPPLPLLQVLLPIGISFYTFMAISYVVDVSRYEIQVSRWLDVSVYLSFFPHLIAGPIVRARGADPPDPAAARRGPDRRVAGVVPDRRRAVQEDGDLGVPREPDRGPGVRRPERARRARGPGGDLRVRDRDLRRLQRVQRHRDRRRAAARVRVPRQLRPPVHRGVAAGLLAAVAHDAVAVAARLPVHPARREPARRGPHGREHHDHDAARRVVARGRVDLRRVGRVPRDRAGDRPMARPAGAGRSGSSNAPRGGSSPASSW